VEEQGRTGPNVRAERADVAIRADSVPAERDPSREALLSPGIASTFLSRRRGQFLVLETGSRAGEVSG
jgi:hypothetical protein